jgi:hypothetical protein
MEIPLMNKLAQVRIAYLQLMINVHQHQCASGTKGAPALFWDLIHEQLEERKRKNKIFNVAFAQLVYEKRTFTFAMEINFFLMWQQSIRDYKMRKQ